MGLESMGVTPAPVAPRPLARRPSAPLPFIRDHTGLCWIRRADHDELLRRRQMARAIARQLLSLDANELDPTC